MFERQRSAKHFAIRNMVCAGAVLAALFFECGASCLAEKPTVSAANFDTPNVVRFTVTNREDRKISVCMTDDLAIERNPHAGLSPFYLEQYVRGGWHVVIGSDIALRFTTAMDKGEQDSFTIAVPSKGRYRVVFLYVKGDDLKDCRSMLDRKHSQVTSPPFDSDREQAQ
jgi:hypothetical protein